MTAYTFQSSSGFTVQYDLVVIVNPNGTFTPSLAYTLDFCDMFVSPRDALSIANFQQSFANALLLELQSSGLPPGTPVPSFSEALQYAVSSTADATSPFGSQGWLS